MAVMARSWWRTRRMRQKVAGEANAIVRGAALDLFGPRFDALPAWVLVNAIAHGDLPRIRSLALSAPPSLTAASDGQAVASFIARDVYDRVGADERLLAALQTAALIPLEVQLFELPPAHHIAPSTLIVAVRQELRVLDRRSPGRSRPRGRASTPWGTTDQ